MASEELKYLDDLTVKQQNDAQKNYEAVKKELEEVTSDKNDVERSIDQKVLKKSLDWSLWEALERNPDLLNNLMKTVEELLKDDTKSFVAWKDHLNNLKQYFDLVKANANKKDAENKNIDNTKEYDKFYGDVSDKQRMETDFQTFAWLLRNGNTLKRLSEMQDSQIRRVQRYLEVNKEAALIAYKAMKQSRNPDKWTINVEGCSSKDNKYFNDIWTTLEDKYGESDYFLKNEFPDSKGFTAELLNNFYSSLWIKWKWDGSNIKSVDLINLKNSVLSKDYLKSNFNTLNNMRRKSNEDFILKFSIDVRTNFRYDGDKLIKVRSNNQVTKENISDYLYSMNVFNDNIYKSDGAFFLDANEMKSTVNACSEKLYNRILEECKSIDAQNAINKGFTMNEDLWRKMNSIKELQGDKAFIKIDGNKNVSYYPEKAAIYLTSLKIKGKEWNYYKRLDTDDGWRQAWISAVQVLLNNDQSLLKDGNEPLKITWELNLSDRNDPTYKRIIQFQGNHKDVFDGRRSGHKVDWLPWPVTIDELIKNQSNIVAGERADLIQSKISWLSQLDLSEFGQKTAYEYWIPDKNITIYRKEWDNDNIYYRQWNDIFKISKDKPWEISQAKLDAGWNVTWESPKVNVCPEWARILGDELKKLDRSILVDWDDKLNYKLTLGEGDTKVNINVGDPVYKAEWFCGKTEMVDRFKLIALAAKVKKEVWNVGVKSGWLWIVKEDSNGDPNTTLMNFNELGVYWVDSSNLKDFVAYCNSLRYDDTNKNYYRYRRFI